MTSVVDGKLKEGPVQGANRFDHAFDEYYGGLTAYMHAQPGNINYPFSGKEHSKRLGDFDIKSLKTYMEKNYFRNDKVGATPLHSDGSC